MNKQIHVESWGSLSQASRTEVRGLVLSEPQVEYAGTIERSIERCRSDTTGDVQGVAIFQGDTVVGFLELKRRLAAPVWASSQTVVVSSLRIDQRFQGQGIGTTALTFLPAFVLHWWSDAESIMLAVDEENGAARRSYEKAGWVETGVREQGRIGWVRYMNRLLDVSYST
jgi:RimJ/RimL family protein N-acetyltransferase